jgi:propionyl-CoA carboxylase alpha chain
MFKKILIANRGEIACRIIKTARRMGIATVAVYSEADKDALHVEMADEAVLIGPPPAAQSYLVIEKILEACQKTGAEAVHPGYGFLSERAAFPRALAAAGLTFIGPNPRAMEAMGDKIESKKFANAADVSTVPGFLGVIADAAHAVRIADEIGYPVMIKASAGGGGKGMRIAHSSGEVEEGFTRARSEALSSFGDDRVFVEKFIVNPRHIEIQVLGDKHGNVIHLGERECSVQRRHQKVIEEAPSPLLDEATRRKMGEQAIALAKAVHYDSAGTVEFVAGQDKSFYFLEMNTRLQVEHPVTELVTGLDLVEQMIKVAAGEPLDLDRLIGPEPTADDARIRLIVDSKPKKKEGKARKRYDLYLQEATVGHFVDEFGEDAREDLAEDLAEGLIEIVPAQRRIGVPMRGWAIESRIYAEDPTRDFLPSTGRLVTYRPPAEGHHNGVVVRNDTGVYEGGEISIHYDPMIAKLVTHAGDRATAIAAQADALDQFVVDGIRHNIAFLAALLQKERWRQGRLSTAFIAEEFPDGFSPRLPEGDALYVLTAVAAAIDHVMNERKRLISGQMRSARPVVFARERSVLLNKTRLDVKIEEGDEGLLVRIEAAGQAYLCVSNWGLGMPVWAGRVDEEAVFVQVRPILNGVALTWRGSSVDARVYTRREAELVALMPEKKLEDRSKTLLCPMPGLIKSIFVSLGQEVKAGEVLCVVEAMKMENVLRAERDGVVKKIDVKEGDSLAVDAPIMEFA